MKKIYKSAVTLSTLLLASLTVFGQTQSRDEVLKELKQKHSEIAALEKDFLEPAKEDETQYAAFLRQPDTGLIRLLPREKFDTETYKGGTKTIVVRGGGAYYSFTRLTHEYGYGSDLELGNNQFSVGFAGADYGFMTNLGDVPIESVGPDTRGVSVFGAYKTPRQEQLGRKEYRRFGDGIDLEGVQVKSRLPVLSDSTYLLRSINYGESDVLVAFRVLHVDSDGSVVIVWKLLKRFGKPDLIQAQTVDIG